LREALASPYNLIAVKVLDAIGIQTMTDLARQLGMTTFDDPDRLGLAVTLGGGEVRLLEMAAAFAALANGGYTVQPVAITRVEDANGNLLLSSPASAMESATTRHRALDERVAYLITDILSDDVARTPSFGQGSALELSRPVAVKTGTTTDFRDNWTVGYTPDLVVGVWAGNADNEPMREISGVTGAAPIWHDFMEIALRGQPVQDFDRPDGLVEVEVCALSGLLPHHDCPHKVTELFLRGTEPAQVCDLHQRIALDRTTGLRATADTPPDRIIEKVYTLVPPEAKEWAREQGIPQPPPVEPAPSPGSGGLASTSGATEMMLTLRRPDAGAVYRLDPRLPRDAQKIEIWIQPGQNVSLRHVTLLVDGQSLTQLSAPPYRAWWLLEPGKHLFSAVGVNVQGQQMESNSVWIKVRE
jgi:membrane peptidoglycan carboxypeptidase